ncbi:hypothetical protein PYCC9005_002548 [Savitreella phatthalungensis]
MSTKKAQIAVSEHEEGLPRPSTSLDAPVRDLSTSGTTTSATSHDQLLSPGDHPTLAAKARHVLAQTPSWADWAFAGILSRLVSCIIVVGIAIAIAIKLSYSDAPDSINRDGLTFDFHVNVSESGIPDLQTWDESLPFNFKLETHAHTTASDGEMSPEQLVHWLSAYGFDGFVLSDHNTLDGYARARAEAAKLNMTVIPAIEYSCCRIHMNLVNVNTTEGLQPTTWPSDDDLRSVIDRTHTLGGYVVVNHLPWSDQTESGWDLPVLPDRPSIDDLLSWGVDAFESVHDNTIDLRMVRESERLGLPIIASNDIHVASNPPYVWNALNVTDRSINGILDALFRRNSTFLYSATGPVERAYFPERQTFGGYNAWAPLTALQFGWLFSEDKGMYSFTGEFCQPRKFELYGSRIFWFVLYIGCFFLMYELGRALILSASTLAIRSWRRHRQHRQALLRP